jgi:hypothetical protein
MLTATIHPDSTSLTARRIQRALDYLSGQGTDIIGECDAGTVYRDDAVDGSYVVDQADLEEPGELLEENVPDAYSHWCAGCGREATSEEVEAAGA